MTVPISTVREQIKSDKNLGIMVQAIVEKQIAEEGGLVLPGENNITDGRPSESEVRFIDFKVERMYTLKELREELFFSRVDDDITRAGRSRERKRYLVSKTRLAGSVSDGDWVVVSWTAPITAKILDQPVGTVSMLTNVDAELRIIGTGKFGDILPHLKDTTYEFPNGAFYVEHEDRLASDGQVQTAEPPTKEYQATGRFGLTEIITLADRTQREAMHLPFHETVLVEGPPGSGKTSIALMRVPCLMDRQWEELELSRERDEPFHQKTTMQILVMNEEMTQYLHNLIYSIGVVGVGVSTFAKFFQQLCRGCNVLGGRLVQESEFLTRAKYHPIARRAYWVGFRAAIVDRWTQEAADMRQEAVALDEKAGLAMLRCFEAWVAAIGNAGMPDGDITKGLRDTAGVNLARALTVWSNRAERELPPAPARTGRDSSWDNSILDDATRKRVEGAGRLQKLREMAKEFTRRFYERSGIVDHMIGSPEFSALCRAACPGEQAAIAEEWSNQTTGAQQQISEADLVLSGWLACHTLLVGYSEPKPVVGDRYPLITHFVVDEAQDMSPNHIAVLNRIVDTRGTMTLVGDLHQRVTARGYFKDWDELGIVNLQRAVFTVNHRQSQPLGSFVHGLHECLYNQTPLWSPSSRSEAPRPRIRPCDNNRNLAAAVLAEVTFWRGQIPNATVAILSHGEPWQGLRGLAQQLETDLADSLTNVLYAVGRGNTDQLNQVDCVVLASVMVTKGLEFDAVVVIDPRGIWGQPVAEMDELTRNGLYVAASRAKQGLSLIISPNAELLRCEALKGRFDLME